jgi:mitochondrial translocator assembly and maintenance protein 41
MLTKGNIPPIYYKILSKFPPHLSFCFAYGSGVKKQIGYDEILTSSSANGAKKKPSMIDIIFSVENPHQFHAQNIEMNPDHYSSLRFLGSKFVAKYQETFASKVYFNTLIPLDNGLMIKYGVISNKSLIIDLLDWDNLYIAGRLQKPVEIIRTPTNSKILSALEYNLENAVRAALLLLPEKFTKFEFYCTITSLSYDGDFRMIFGENKNKVQNIVSPQLENFENLYSPTFKIFDKLFEYPTGDVIECKQDKSAASILHHLNLLPKWPVRRIVKEWNRGKYRMDTEDVLRAVACSNRYRDTVKQSLQSIVWQSSIKQSIKNIPTAGISKSLSYSWSKALKTFNL